MAIDAIPGRPRLRIDRTMADHVAPLSRTSRPTTCGASVCLMTSAIAVCPYAKPEAAHAGARLDVDDDDRGLVPGERAVGLGRLRSGSCRPPRRRRRHRTRSLLAAQPRCAPMRWSATRAASDMIVSAGLADPCVGSTLPSVM